jgi:hypothetical protein
VRNLRPGDRRLVLRGRTVTSPIGHAARGVLSSSGRPSTTLGNVASRCELALHGLDLVYLIQSRVSGTLSADYVSRITHCDAASASQQGRASIRGF